VGVAGGARSWTGNPPGRPASAARSINRPLTSRPPTCSPDGATEPSAAEDWRRRGSRTGQAAPLNAFRCPAVPGANRTRAAAAPPLTRNLSPAAPPSPSERVLRGSPPIQRGISRTCGAREPPSRPTFSFAFRAFFRQIACASGGVDLQGHRNGSLSRVTHRAVRHRPLNQLAHVLRVRILRRDPDARPYR
jgi:hypothetical protein